MKAFVLVSMKKLKQEYPEAARLYGKYYAEVQAEMRSATLPRIKNARARRTFLDREAHRRTYNDIAETEAMRALANLYNNIEQDRLRGIRMRHRREG